MAKNLKITLVHSTIGSKPAHRATVQTLGLRKIGQSVVRDSKHQHPIFNEGDEKSSLEEWKKEHQKNMNFIR